MEEGLIMKNLYIITGANGHLGRTLIQKLKEDHQGEIRGLILPSEKGFDDHVHYVQGDITKLETLHPLFDKIKWKKVYVIHAAGIIDIQEHVSKQIYDVNVNGTKNIIELCQQYKVKRLLYVSSVHAIQETNKLNVIQEVNHFDAELVHGGYAKTKAEATQAVLDACKNGLDAVIVHPSGILGPYGNESNHLVQMVMDYIQGNLPAGIQGGYDFVDVRDVANGCLLALTKAKAGECYILSNRYYEIKDVLAMVREVTGRRKLSMLPMWVANAALPFMDILAKIRKQRPLYTKYSLFALQSNARFSHDKATQELGYLPRDLKETIYDTIVWHQKQDR